MVSAQGHLEWQLELYSNNTEFCTHLFVISVLLFNI